MYYRQQTMHNHVWIACCIYLDCRLKYIKNYNRYTLIASWNMSQLKYLEFCGADDGTNIEDMIALLSKLCPFIM